MLAALTVHFNGNIGVSLKLELAYRGLRGGKIIGIYFLMEPVRFVVIVNPVEDRLTSQIHPYSRRHAVRTVNTRAVSGLVFRRGKLKPPYTTVRHRNISLIMVLPVPRKRGR